MNFFGSEYYFDSLDQTFRSRNHAGLGSIIRKLPKATINPKIRHSE
ncbi:10869_t:CDS:2, partial [Gigaspora margarita]